YPDNAWLVLACDIPLLDKKIISGLISFRNSTCIATAFKSPFDGFPEPLAAIWEPKSYPLILQFLAQGYDCPRKVLINSDTHIIETENPEKLANINTPEELLALKK